MEVPRLPESRMAERLSVGKSGVGKNGRWADCRGRRKERLPESPDGRTAECRGERRREEQTSGGLPGGRRPEGKERIMSEKLVTVIIPNYNGLQFMGPCMDALEHQNCQDFHVLVVDNGSTDGSVEWLKRQGIPSLFLGRNTGFPGAVNAGIRAAKTPYVLLLNNDTEADPDMVGQLLAEIRRSRRIFAVSGKMIQMYHRDRMDDAGDMYSLMGWAYQRGVGRSSKGYNRPMEVFSACAAAAIYRRSVFDEIGLFDERHFAYLEDIDVCYRAKIHGYHNRYCPAAVVYHVGSGTSGSKYNSFKVRLAARNNVYLNYKNMPLGQLLVNSPLILAGVAVKYGFFRGIGFGKEYAEGFLEGLCTCGKCRKEPFRGKWTQNYLAIQWELIVGTCVYIYEFSSRQAAKLRKPAGR